MGEGVMGDATLESCPHGWSRWQHEGELWLEASRCGGRDAVGEENLKMPQVQQCLNEREMPS